ncbi:MAG: LysE family transporter [Chitinophagaceae bacterium]|nr:LysE family transporter [Chitinophagaceae bacterium]
MWEAIVSGLTLGLVLAISVGPVIFTIIKQSLVNGKEGGFCFVTGVWLSDIVLVIISNAFSEVVKSLMIYEKPLGLIGSAFLILMGVFYVFFKKIKLQANTQESFARFRKRDMAKIFSSGFLINTLNPNVFIFWLATATNFAIKYSFEQRMIIFTVCLALNIAADTFKVLMAGKLRNRLTLHNISVINKISGTLLIGFGIALLFGTIFLAEKIK